MIVSVIGIGWWLGSEAMQWLGFVMLCISLIGRATGAATSNRMTPQAAANFLYQKFGVQAEGLK